MKSEILLQILGLELIATIMVFASIIPFLINPTKILSILTVPLFYLNTLNNAEIPESFDWRDYGFVREPPNQLNCNISYIFNVVGSIEAAFAIKTGKFTKLSVQEILDCCGDRDSCGNNPAIQYPYRIMDCMIKLYEGLEKDEDYPYEADIKELPLGDELALKRYIATVGPVAAIIDGELDSFRNYKSGIYFDKLCKTYWFNVRQGVLVVGYGTDAQNGDYWIVQNSWGSLWGEQGYFRLARNRNNHCGIATFAAAPIL